MKSWFVIMVAVALMALPARVHANADMHHDEAFAAVSEGIILPLDEILVKLRKEFAGRIMNVRLEDGREGLHGWVYHIRMFDEDGKVLEIDVDAGTATVLKIASP